MAALGQEEEQATIAPEKPSQLFVHTVTAATNPQQRAMRFNLNQHERQLFVASRTRLTLYQHQEEGVAFMKLRETPGNEIGGSAGGIIQMPPRVGKTKTFMTLIYRDIQERVRRKEPRFGMPTLLIVPKNVVDTMAYENMDLFAEGHELIHYIILGDNALRETDLHGIIMSHDLIITSYSALMAFYHRWEESFGLTEDVGPQLMFNTKWRRVIADEAHRLANHKNVIFNAVATLKADHFWYVTATPIQNSPTDVLSALRFIRVNEVFLKMTTVPVLLPSLLFRRDYDDLIKINPAFARLKPPTHEQMRRAITWNTESERLLYLHIEAQSFMHLDSTPVMEGSRPANVFTQDVRPENMGLRMRQACVSPWLLPADFVLPEGMRYASPEVDGVWWRRWMESRLMGTIDSELDAEGWPPPHVLPPMSSKELDVMNDIRINIEPRGEKGVYFSEWTGSLDRLHRLIKERAYIRQGHRDSVPEDGVVCVNGSIKGVARKNALQNMWKDPKKYIMLVTLQSGGLGEDFTFANHGCLLESWWCPATEYQALMRLYGMKQTRTISMSILCIENTVEDYVIARANQKRGYEAVMTLGTPQTPAEENDDPMAISGVEDDGTGLLLDPEDEPTIFDPNWMNNYLQQAVRRPQSEYQETEYHF